MGIHRPFSPITAGFASSRAALHGGGIPEGQWSRRHHGPKIFASDTRNGAMMMVVVMMMMINDDCPHRRRVLIAASEVAEEAIR